MKKAFVETVFILLLSLFLALIFNYSRQSPFPLFSKSEPLQKEKSDLHFRELSWQEVEQFCRQPDFLLIDARSPEQFKRGHLPGAINLYVYEFDNYFKSLEEKLRRYPFLIIYCSSKSCHDSEILAEKLYLLGFRSIYLYRNGFAEWRELKKEIENEER